MEEAVGTGILRRLHKSGAGLQTSVDLTGLRLASVAHFSAGRGVAKEGASLVLVAVPEGAEVRKVRPAEPSSPSTAVN